MKSSLHRVGIKLSHRTHILQEFCGGTSDCVRCKVVTNNPSMKIYFFQRTGDFCKVIVKTNSQAVVFDVRLHHIETCEATK